MKRFLVTVVAAMALVSTVRGGPPDSPRDGPREADTALAGQVRQELCTPGMDTSNTRGATTSYSRCRRPRTTGTARSRC